jgi:hypothetical protein
VVGASAGALMGFRDWVAEQTAVAGAVTWRCRCGVVHTPAITVCACGGVIPDSLVEQLGADAAEAEAGARSAVVCGVCELSFRPEATTGWRFGICDLCWSEHDAMVAEEAAEKRAQVASNDGVRLPSAGRFERLQQEQS